MEALAVASGFCTFFNSLEEEVHGDRPARRGPELLLQQLEVLGVRLERGDPLMGQRQGPLELLHVRRPPLPGLPGREAVRGLAPFSPGGIA